MILIAISIKGFAGNFGFLPQNSFVSSTLHSFLYHADDAGIIWYQGAIVLANQTVHTGELAVQYGYDLVLLREDDHITVYPAFKIASLRLYDDNENINRKFISLPQVEKGVTLYRLYEVVLQGDISVLRCAKAAVNSPVKDESDFDYFTLHGAKLSPLHQFRSKVYPLLLDYNKEAMLAFMTEEKLNPNRSADAIQLIRFYDNLIRKAENSLARN